MRPLAILSDIGIGVAFRTLEDFGHLYRFSLFRR